MSSGNFFAELKRRNVIRMAGLYLVGAWLLIQVASTVLPIFDVPPWALRGLIITLALGFIPALIFSWVFEMTPQGLKRDEDVRPEQSIAPQTARRMDRMIIVVLLLALGYFCVDKFILAPRRQAAEPAPLPNEPSTPTSAKSIAVLPFENLSEDKANAYFADGIQDEILARLAKIADLKVISRTSTQKYKSAPTNLRDIATQLGVANILEGSVQKSKDQVRITVQLINALNDSHLWAETYDRKLIDVFQVETDLAQKIASSLEARLTGREKAEIAVRGTENSEAYDAYLHARTLLNRQGAEDLENAIKFARRAVELDPGYAQAWALLGNTEAQKYFYPEHTEPQLARARAAAEKALQLAPEFSDAHAAMGAFYYYCLQDFDRALAELSLAHERAPNDAIIVLGTALVKRRQGKLDESIALQQEAAKLDPLNEDVWVNIARSYRGIRKFEEARAYFDRALTMTPNDPAILYQRAETYLAQGDLDTCWKTVEHLKFPPTDRGFGFIVSVVIAQRRFDDAEKMIVAALASSDLPPVFTAVGHFALANLRIAKGDRAAAQPLLLQAESELNRLRASGDNGLFLRGALLEVEARLGHRDEAQRLADSNLETTKKDAWQFPREEEQVARAYLVLGQFDRALPLLEHALSAPAVEALTPALLRFDPIWDPVRSDPRFQKLAGPKP
ncbi:MAG: adenylate cyclase [Verrucomicrobiota bacterium]|jgi:TolB-like protein/cytochrome c-type biogenesis protein CcmH/NrfG